MQSPNTHTLQDQKQLTLMPPRIIWRQVKLLFLVILQKTLSLLCRMKYKHITGTNNSTLYIQLLTINQKTVYRYCSKVTSLHFWWSWSWCQLLVSGDEFHNGIYIYMKAFMPGKIKKVFYFSDGCADQYKNCKNFRNLCFHKSDFHVDCEWNFFATSHGKSPCGGLGGTVKRLTARASLQRPLIIKSWVQRRCFSFSCSFLLKN